MTYSTVWRGECALHAMRSAVFAGKQVKHSGMVKSDAMS
jgi:hypothetical protein